MLKLMFNFIRRCSFFSSSNILNGSFVVFLEKQDRLEVFCAATRA
jgi:hypothetical protein